jgi:hypothetical protein
MGGSSSKFTQPFTENQLKTFVLLPKVTAAPSLLACAYIIQHVLRSKKRRGRVYDRILLLMSLNDFIFALKTFFS